ncbi:MAG: tryptophan-rich sensory protein [Cryomorphaceae bacterium]|nr:MAG: tryptophan-rich sensory protein [Cryomorphaceae bacterium]
MAKCYYLWVIRAQDFIALVICIAIPLMVGGLSGYLTAGGTSTWYQELDRPSFTPPGFLFGIVWPILYALMGISLYLVWSSEASPLKGMAYTAFFIQLGLNFLWSFLFFNFKELGWALAEIGVLWVCILWMILSFYKVSPWAAYLQVPYLMWVSFATVLNAAFYWLNR